MRPRPWPRGSSTGWAGDHARRPDARGSLRPQAAPLGAIFLLVMDGVVCSVPTTEVPLGVLTALVGAPFFLLPTSGRRAAST
ncbi:iron chelate uptake ABC transporter family permease subunit [Pseudonocardia xinjiangensis]|uniref:iron chelate uptake ABC transporter family permease subunit n=1 Tax=Pseudonocardia xinjiangensis TaxID=75289 RepID=UPI003D8D6A8F